MLTTKTGNVSAPLLMNVDDRMGSCRDKGWIWGRVGALCLSLVATRSSGDCVEHKGRTPTRTSTRPPHPLHPAPCPYRTRDAPFSIRLSNIIRTLGTQAFRWCNYPIRLSPFSRDKGRMWGRVGAWCLSWWQRDPVGISWSKQVAPQRGQAPGPLIHSTPPLVPTGPWAASISMDMITRFGRHNSSDGRVSSSMGIIELGKG